MPGCFADTNVWIASNFEGHPHNSLAIAFLDGRSVENPVIFSRAVENSTLRLLSNPSLCRGLGSQPLTNQQAATILTDWRSQDRVQCLDAEPAGTRDLWLKLAAIPSPSPNVWMDAYLAAFAIRAGLPFATLDADFRQFEAAGLALHLLSA